LKDSFHPYDRGGQFAEREQEELELSAALLRVPRKPSGRGAIAKEQFFTLLPTGEGARRADEGLRAGIDGCSFDAISFRTLERVLTHDGSRQIPYWGDLNSYPIVASRHPPTMEERCLFLFLFAQREQNSIQNICKIFVNIIAIHAMDRKALGFKVFCTLPIVEHCVFIARSSTIYFNNKTVAHACEVSNIWRDRYLAPEFEIA
jgi:hypothetical protein